MSEHIKEYIPPHSIDALRQNVENFAENPSMLQRTILEHLSHVTEHGIEIVDSSNPVAFTVEASAVLSAHAIKINHLNTRKQYPVSAITEEDLYLHMSDVDYIGRFAKPSRARFYLMFDIHELEDKMVFDEELNIRRLIIPRNTELSVNKSLYFTLEYPIEIRQMLHGGFQVLYDTEIPSPLDKLSTNLIPHSIRKLHELTKLVIEISMLQLKATSHTMDISPATSSVAVFDFEDDFHYARLYHNPTGDKWVEILTTHIPELYDPKHITASLRVVDNQLKVFVPQIYTRTGMLTSALRVDIYTTKGDVMVNMGAFKPDELKLEFKPFDKKRDVNKFTQPVSNMNTIRAFSDDLTTGGRNKLSFEELRQRVIHNTIGPKSTPISNVDIKTVLQDEGFDNVQYVDLVTNRIYLASKQLPVPRNNKLITSANLSIERFITSVNDLKDHEHIYFNGESVTITPDVIFENTKGYLSIVDDAYIGGVLALPPEMRANEINKRNIFYTPFHYVMDMRNHMFDFRAYHLNNPAIMGKSFDMANPTSLLEVSIDDSWEIRKTRHGFELYIITDSSDDFKKLQHEEVIVQLAYRPTGEKDLAYVLGEFVGANQDKERIYKFNFDTRWNVDENNELVLTNFKMYNTEAKEIPVKLEQSFQITFLTTRNLGPQYRETKLDKDLAHFMLPVDVKTIIREEMTILFGHTLNSLWKQARTISSTEQYETYDADVPLIYENDVFEMTSDTEYTLVHKKGDPVLNTRGEPVMKHKRGEIRLDEDGNKIVSNTRQLSREMDIMLVEGAYYFATDDIAIGYREEIIDIFLDWLTDGLDELNKSVLEQTRIYFYPRATLGNVPILYDNGIRGTIRAQQSMVVDLVVSRNVYANLDLRENISKSTVRIISELLKDTTISNSLIYARLVEQYGEDVLGVKLVGLGGELEVTAFTILDDTKRCVLKKRLVTQPDNTLIVEEDVTINFLMLDGQQKIW